MDRLLLLVIAALPLAQLVLGCVVWPRPRALVMVGPEVLRAMARRAE